MFHVFNKNTNTYEQARIVINANVYFFVTSLLPHGKQVGNDWLTLNPARQDANIGSFRVSLTNACFYDFATGDKGDAIALYSLVKNCSIYDSAKAIASNNYCKFTEQQITHSTSSPKVFTTKKEKADFLRDVGKFIQSWAYHNENGDILYRTGKFINPAGKKSYLPVNSRGYRCKKPITRRVLYNLPELLKEKKKPVLIVEGEKCADAGTALFHHFVVTTSSGGACNAGNQEYINQWDILTDRDVIISRDCDSAGIKYQDAIINILKNKAKSISILDTEFLALHTIDKRLIKRTRTKAPPSYDIADAWADGFTFEAMNAFQASYSNCFIKKIY